MDFVIRSANAEDLPEWLRMRQVLWPDGAISAHESELRKLLSQPDRYGNFVAVRATGGLGGFLEASIRGEVEGCSTPNVGYIEGWFVDADIRRSGVGRRLVVAAEAWARQQGCREMASDVEIENEPSQAAHRRLGFQEAARLVIYRKSLDPARASRSRDEIVL